MIYVLYISCIIVICLATLYPYIKIDGKYPTYKIKNVFSKRKKTYSFRYSTSIIFGIFAFIVLLILDLTLSKDALIIDPIAFSIFGFGIHWYALWILLGVVVAVIAGVKEGKKIGIYSDFIYTGILIILPCAIIGARIWYVLFNLDQFPTIGHVLGLKDGWAGLGIQGGIIMALIVLFIYCRCNKIPLFKALDVVAPGFLIGQIFGRWGNFCNHELYGPAISNPSLFEAFFPRFITENMYISHPLDNLAAGYFQPMFLYESMLNLVGLIIMLILRRKSKKLESGDMLGLYLIWYGIVRTITESFRHEGEVLLIGNIRVSIVMSLIFIICGILFLILKRKFFNRVNYQELIQTIKENKVEGIIFDLDGTLLDSKELIYRSFIHTFEHFYPEHNLSDAELDSFFGPTLHQTFSKYTTDEEKINEMIAYYREFNIAKHDELVKLFPGVKDTLEYLHKNNYKLGVVSSKKKDLVIHALEYFKIAKYFDVILGGDDVEKPKPDPEGILKAKVIMKVKKAIYVGDSVSDLKAGKAAGIKVCAIAYKKDNGRAYKLQEENPDYFIESMFQLVKKIGE